MTLPENRAYDLSAIPPERRCVACGTRWKQEGDLCRLCFRTEHPGMTVAEIDRLQDARRRARLALAEAPPEPPPKPRRVAVYDGQAFEIMWDGRK